MKKDQVFGIAVVLLSILFVASTGRSADITATGSGNWSSTTPNAPWPDGIVPSTNDSVDIEAPFAVTVDTNVTCAYIYGGGTVTMAAGVTLDIMGDAGGAYGAQQLAVLNATAPGNTVNYHGNAFWAKRTDYQNLVFSGYGDFYNGIIPGYPTAPMNIAGDMLVSGTNVAVQQGDNITIGGNLLITGPTNKWDCSSYFLTVSSNTVLTGTRSLLVDLDGALGSNYFGGSMTVGSNALAWNVSDVIHWAIGGSLTNQGLIAGKGYGSIDFGGSGVITGKPLKLPTITISGSYLIGTTITLTTNTPTLLGTMIFDLANTNQIYLQSYPTNALTFYYDSTLTVINSGATPVAGNSYKLFSATNFDGSFDVTNFPSLPDGLIWVDNLLTNGSIAVASSVTAPPTLTVTKSNLVLTLSWDSGTYTGYSVQIKTNMSGTWTGTGSGTTSPYVTTVCPTCPPIFYRLIKP